MILYAPRRRVSAIGTRSIMKAAFIVMGLFMGLALQAPPAFANYGYCFAKGLLGGTKVFIHTVVHEADFWDGATVYAYRAELENSHRFRFGPLTCPGFDTEAEAKEHLAATRTAHLRDGFAEFIFPRAEIGE
jgi:hypothetical protein